MIVSTATWSEHQQAFSERMSTFSKLRTNDNCAIYIIFNALNNDDTVYVEDDKDRELLLNREYDYHYGGADKGDTGFWYTVSRWIHSQFEEDTMMYVMHLLSWLSHGSRNVLEVSQRGNIVQISRKFTNGITDLVFGKWHGDFSGATKLPSEWTGTSEIVATRLRTGQSARYGQCWVYANVMVTLMRCLGVASRAVTCIRSAHDTDHTLTIDIDHRVKKAEEIWNFHVWTEIWCRRNDLPAGFDGWQVIDGTPQELSEGFNQCGPMSVKAVKMGQLNLGYDGWFIYGEINADVCVWIRDANGQLINTITNTNDVGRAILTANVPGIEEPLNITSSYKYPEGSTDERSHHMRAMRELRVLEREAKLRQFYANEKVSHVEDILVSVSDNQQIDYGSDIAMKITLENKGDNNRTVNLVLRLDATDHTGRVVAQIKEFTLAQNLMKGEKKVLTFRVSPADYAKHVVKNQPMSFSASATVLKTNQFIFKADKFYIAGTAISIKEIPEDASVNEKFPVTLYFRNPQTTPLRNVELFLHSGTHHKMVKVNRFPGSVDRNGKVRIRCKVRGVSQGERVLFATVKCDQLSSMTTSRSIHISAP
uniref:TGc domain-containing protein n=1 Tax=Steinernema glaseri TaxID=37863 RepID=A0A1I7Z0F2_9BILA